MLFLLRFFRSSQETLRGRNLPSMELYVTIKYRDIDLLL